MRQRLLSYLTAACINLAIVGGIHEASLVARPPIVRVRARDRACGRFDRRELLSDDSIVVRPVKASKASFSSN